MVSELVKKLKPTSSVQGRSTSALIPSWLAFFEVNYEVFREIHDMACSLGSMKLAKSPELISSVFSWAFRNKQIQELITEQYFAYLAKRKEKATK